MQDQLQKAELTFKHKVAAYERSALDNWVKARFWERKLVQQSRENAYMKHRLHMMRRETPPEGSMRQEPMPGRSEIWNRVQRESRPVPRMNSSTSPKKDPEMATVGTDVRGFCRAPRPPQYALPHAAVFTRLYWLWLLQPPPHGWTGGPHPQLVPPPH
uniref:Transport and Golgi organization protein 1 homolog n=1 Tax=Callorhinus ursinus TaxID=34884 RepID=A0A3Q7MWM9_CALUR